MHSATWVVFGTTYAAVLIAEILGDKLLYTTGVLSFRFRAIPILVGVSLAIAVKMAVAVALGQWIARLPRWLGVATTATAFLGLAIRLMRKPEIRARNGGGSGALLSFATVLLSEWGDAGQLTTAALAARGMPMIVWTAAVCAIATKAAVAALLGARIRVFMGDRIAPTAVRYSSVAAVLVLGALSMV